MSHSNKFIHPGDLESKFKTKQGLYDLLTIDSKPSRISFHSAILSSKLFKNQAKILKRFAM